MKRTRQTLFGSRKRKLISGAAVALIVPAIAFAAWTLSASNVPFKQKTGTLTAVTFSPVAFGSLSDPLFPGTSGDAVVSYNNSNAYAVEIQSITGSPVITDDSGGACPIANYSFSTAGLVGTVIPAGSGTITLDDAFSLADTAPNTCQNKEVTATIPTVTYGVGS